MTYTASCCAPSLSPTPASLQQGCICLVHCVFPRVHRIMVPPGFLGLPGSLFLCLLTSPFCAFLPRHWPGWMAHAAKLSAGTTALCWLSWPFGKGLFYRPQSLSKGSQSQHGASSFLPQQFPSSGYQPQIQPPEPLIRKVLGNVLKERTGGKRTVLVLRLFTASLIFQVSLTDVETDSFQKFCIVPVQV